VRVAALLLLLATACQQTQKADPLAAASAGANAAAVASAAASVAVPAKAWFEGAWQGVFRAELFRVETAAGGVKEWKQDDGKVGSGEGKLTLEAASDGSVTGSSSGALGNLAVSGHVDGDRVALVLSSAEPAGFHGVILATQTPDGMQGTLNASSGDSLQARQAKVTISRAGK
jgi:hypothetical protein